MDETTFTFPTDDGESIFVYRWTGEGEPQGDRADRPRHGRARGPLPPPGRGAGRRTATSSTPTTTAATGAPPAAPSARASSAPAAGTVWSTTSPRSASWPARSIRACRSWCSATAWARSRSSSSSSSTATPWTAPCCRAPRPSTSSPARSTRAQPADLTAFNAPFEPARTEFDWLSRDPDEVDLYVADPMCGFGVDAEGTAGMLSGAGDLGDPDRLSAIRPDLPIYVLSGEADPLSGAGALDAARRRPLPRCGCEGRERRASTPAPATSCSTRRTVTR